MRILLILPLLTACGLFGPGPPPAVPSVDDAVEHLELVVEAAIAKDFETLCSLATGTCEGELEGFEHLAPDEAPTIAATTVHQPQQVGNGWSSGGVLFVLCGEDATGEPYESEVLVFDDAGRGLLATAAVFWTGTSIGFSPPGGGPVDEAPDEPARC